jgi:preprotein translocase subunit SecA
MWGRKGMEKIKQKGLEKLAPKIDKEDMLAQLRGAWTSQLKGSFNVEEELVKARNRIETSGSFKLAFDKVGISDNDLRKVLTDIKENKPKPIIRTEPKTGRNDPCPCGSEKKYKKCCGKGG